MPTKNIAVVVHIKSDFESWEKLMLSSLDNQDAVNSGKQIYAKVNDKKAILIRYDMDMEERTSELIKVKALSPRFLRKTWEQLPKELRDVIAQQYQKSDQN